MDVANRLVLICVDSSEHSSKAMEWYFREIHQEDNFVGIIHVQTPPIESSFLFLAGGTPSLDLYREKLNEAIEKTKALLEHYKKMIIAKGVLCENIKVFHRGIDGCIGNTICKVATENNVSLIVIGQRGLGTLRRTLLGSVSSYVLHHSHIPVAVVPPE